MQGYGDTCVYNFSYIIKIHSLCALHWYLFNIIYIYCIYIYSFISIITHGFSFKDAGSDKSYHMICRLKCRGQKLAIRTAQEQGLLTEGLIGAAKFWKIAVLESKCWLMGKVLRKTWSYDFWWSNHSKIHGFLLKKSISQPNDWNQDWSCWPFQTVFRGDSCRTFLSIFISKGSEKQRRWNHSQGCFLFSVLRATRKLDMAIGQGNGIIR